MAKRTVFTLIFWLSLFEGGLVFLIHEDSSFMTGYFAGRLESESIPEEMYNA